MSNLTNATESHYHHPSYAQAAAHNAPPSSAQPHPDKNLLYTGPSPTHPTTAPDLDTKVSVVPHDWAAHPTTETSLHISITHSPTDTDSDDDDNQGANLNRRPKSNVRKQREKRKGNTCKSKREFSTSPPFTPRLFIPGLVTFLNLGVLSSIGYTLYAHPHARTNPRFLCLSGLGVFALLSVEGLTAQRYLDSPYGHQTQQEIVTLKRKSKEIILRPVVFDRLLGALNLTVLATLSWFAYDRWNDARVWTRRNISTTSLGLLLWFGGQARYATKEREKREEGKARKERK